MTAHRPRVADDAIGAARPQPITAHARDRCEERYGYRPVRADALAALADLEAGRGCLVNSKGRGGEIWLLRLGPVTVRALVDRAMAVIVTVLPPNGPGTNMQAVNKRERGGKNRQNAFLSRRFRRAQDAAGALADGEDA